MANNNDPKVVFKVELDDSEIRGQLNGVVSKLDSMGKSKKVSVHIDASAESARTAIKTVEGELNGLNGRKATASLDADSTSADAATKKMDSDLDKLNGQTATANLDADSSAADAATDKVDSDLDALNGRTATAILDANITSAQTQIDTINSALDGLDGRTATVNVDANNNSSSSSGSSAAGKIKDVASDFIGGIFDAGMAFETSQAKASTLMPDGVDMGAYSDRILALSTTYGQDAATYNEAVYNMLSAGQNIDAIMAEGGLLDLASQMSIGGFTDIDTAAGMLAKMGNAYGTTDYAQMAQNALLTQKYGITDVGQLAATMPMANSAASNAGVSQENLMSAMAAITSKGVPTNVAGTQMKALVNELDKKGTTGQNILAKIYGRGATLSSLMADGKTLGEIALAYQAYGEKKGKSFSDMFSSQEAGSAIANMLTTDEETGIVSTKVFDAAMEDMGRAAEGTLDEVGNAYNKMSDTTAFTIDKIKAQFSANKIKLFDALAPSIEKLLDVMNTDEFRAATGKLIDGITDLLSADNIDKFVDALIAAAEWLLKVVNGDISIGEALGSIVSKVSELLLETLKTGMQGLVDALIAALPPSVKKLLGVTSEEPTTATKSTSFTGKVTSGLFGGLLGFSSPSTDKVVTESAQRGSGVGRKTSEKSSTDVEKNTGTLAENLESASGKAGESATAAQTISDKLAQMATAVNNAITRCNSAGRVTYGSGAGRKHSVGTSYVPYDGYAAILHRGEMVLTAAQASYYRTGSQGAASGGIDYSALANAMSGMSMTMDSKVVGKIIERSVSSAQGARYAREQRGLK